MTIVHSGPVLFGNLYKWLLFTMVLYCSAVLLKLDVSSRPWAKRHQANVWSAKTTSLRLKLAQERPDTLFFLITIVFFRSKLEYSYFFLIGRWNFLYDCSQIVEKNITVQQCIEVSMMHCLAIFRAFFFSVYLDSFVL